MKNILMAGLLLFSLSAAADKRDFSLDVPVDALERFELQAKVGEVIVRAAETDVIEIRVRLESDDKSWFGKNKSDSHRERLAAAELRHDSRGDTLRVNLDYDRSGLTDNDLQEKWEIRLPAKFALRADLNVGRTEIRGIGGGVDAEVNVGELSIEVPGGSIDAKVNVGELGVRSATASPGRFDLDVNIGEARLEIDGRSAGETSGWIGKSVTHKADGDDDVSARVNVGEVRVSVRR